MIKDFLLIHTVTLNIRISFAILFLGSATENYYLGENVITSATGLFSLTVTKLRISKPVNTLTVTGRSGIYADFCEELNVDMTVDKSNTTFIESFHPFGNYLLEMHLLFFGGGRGTMNL